MISYELAQKLHSAGFPQPWTEVMPMYNKDRVGYLINHDIKCTVNDAYNLQYGHNNMTIDLAKEFFVPPTLEELIKEGAEILNFAEYLYAVQESAEFREAVSKDWIWTSSCDSGGGHVDVGFLPEGLSVGHWFDDRRGSDLGVTAARKVGGSGSGTLESVESLSLPEFLVINNIKYRKDE